MTAADRAPAELAQRITTVHRRFPTGVTVVTTTVDGEPFGLALNAFSSVSLTPPTVLFCVSTSAATHPRLAEASHVGVNFLAHDQAAIAARFAKSGGDKFADIAWQPSSFGSPIIDGASGHLDVEIEQRLPAYTHTIFIGQIVDAAAEGGNPLLYLGGRFYDSDEFLPPADTR